MILLLVQIVYGVVTLLTSGLPSREELLILALGLGGSGNNYEAIDRPGSDFRPAGGSYFTTFMCWL